MLFKSHPSCVFIVFFLEVIVVSLEAFILFYKQYARSFLM